MSEKAGLACPWVKEAAVSESEMGKDFDQIAWDAALEEACRQVVRLAAQEDLGLLGDCTTLALVGESALGRANIVARQGGIVAGLPAVPLVLEQFDARLRFSAAVEDGSEVRPGQPVGQVEGPARGLLSAERTLLNLLGRLSGIATLTRRYVQAVAGTQAQIYDTRKTTPGWRRLEKYAVRCGGGRNHRLGLFDAVLIKDNHLAWGAETSAEGTPRFTPAQAVARARQWIKRRVPGWLSSRMIVEVEVESLEQLSAVLPARPDVVLLDNMPPALLVQAVARRNAAAPYVLLEASGGVTLETVRAIAETGVDRISVGALTHSARALDFGLDWCSDALQ